MVRRSRLAGIRSAFGRLESRLRPVPQYSLSVSMGAPDHMVIDLLRDGQFARKVGEIDAANSPAGALDVMGRLRPEAVWDRLGQAKQNLAETEGISASLPGRFDIAGANYINLSAHPRMD